MLKSMSGRVVTGLLCVSSCLAAFFLGIATAPEETAAQVTEKRQTPDARRAYNYLVSVCKIGPRQSGSAGMAKQQQLIVQHFQRFGAQVQFQSFDVPHPLSGAPVRMSNVLVSWHPERKERVLLVCHYDTRPYPDRDPRDKRGIFIGANDGASGVALFMELAHHMRKIRPKFGVDFLFVDGEEFVFSDNDSYFLGSTHFAQQYKVKPPGHRYVCGAVVDMVADKRLSLYMETNSLRMAPDVTRSIWDTAKKLRVKEFVARQKHEVRDDHLPLNQIAGIPTCDIIDFDYPYWHTTKDNASNCSGASLAKVGQVLLHWLEDMPGIAGANAQ